MQNMNTMDTQEEKKLNGQESLELINSMISNTRMQLTRGAGVPFLIWGYTTVAVSLWEYAMHYFHLCWGWGWFALPVIGWVLTYLYSRRSERHEYVRSYVDRAIYAVWTVFGVSVLFAFGAALVYKISMFFMMTLLIGMGTTITGAIIRSKAVTAGGALTMLSSTIFALRHMFLPEVREMGREALFAYSMNDMLIFAAIFFLLMCIPGHILVRRAKANDENRNADVQRA